jgi:putative methyltransferase (TIGR04325 family)
LFKIRGQKYGFFGDYVIWEEAKRHCSGYESENILQKVKESLLKVKKGEAVYERDSVLFNEIQYSYPLLAGLMWIAAQNEGKLTVLDFGGSLGSTYFQSKKFLDTLPSVEWSIVEQKHFVKCGKEHFEDEKLRFYESIDNCLKERIPNTIILSGVIQYLEKPYELLDYILDKEFEYILIDRTPFAKNGKERIVIQIVPPSIYEASYPMWLLNKERFIVFWMKKYGQVVEFEGRDRSTKDIEHKGFIFRRF